MNILEILGAILVAFVGGGLALWSAVVAGKVELKKRKPETIVHHCRLAKLDAYTFIKGSKKQTPPLCPYLDPSDYETCRFDSEGSKEAAKMKEVNNDKCYIALFTDKFDLE